MDDIEDANEAIARTVESLRLAGVDDINIASGLVARGLLMRLMDGVSVNGVLDEVKDMLVGFAKDNSR